MATMMRICSLCDSPVPIRLAMLGCRHLFHSACIGAHLRQHGNCPYSECGRRATVEDLHELIVDSPQPVWGENAPRGVQNVIAVIRERLAGAGQSCAVSEDEAQEVESTFKLIFSEEAQNQVGGGNADLERTGWKKLVELAKKASPVVALVILGVLCWVYWPLVTTFAGALVDQAALLITGLASFLRGYFPEIVATVIGFFSIFVGKKKLSE